MKKAYALIVVIVVVLFLAAGSFYYYMNRTSSSTEIRISTNPWVGFTPFVYAQEKGWLEGTPFRFVWVGDLSENARLYNRGFTRGFTATQYELLHSKKEKTIVPVFLIDRSAGADAILSNRTLRELKQERRPVKVYLERGSLTEDFFEAFVREAGLELVPFVLIDASQNAIVSLESGDEAVVAISYAPYLGGLRKNGLEVISSTATLKGFYVIDALFVEERVIDADPKAFGRLKELFALAVKRYEADPREYYETVRGYLEGESYEEFRAMMEGIELLHERSPVPILSHLNAQNVRTDRLLP